jgi:hypothetical protein
MTGMLVLALACAGVHPLAGFRAWSPAAAEAQTGGVDSAQELYDQGRFADAAAAIRDGIATGRITGSEIVRARELLARCQVKVGDVASARRTFLALLEQDPLYRPDPLRIPPDEMEAYTQARREFDEGRERASQRLPASVALYYGIGTGANKDFGEFVADGGGDEEYENDPHFGGIVRFPVAPRFSLDIEVQRFRATNADSFPPVSRSTYEITAIPVSLSLSYLVLDGPRFRAFAFAGGGPMLEATSSVSLPFFGIPLRIADDKVGVYAHGGLDGEYRVHPRFSLAGRVLGRYAKASGLFEGTDFDPYVTNVSIADRDLDFSGFAATLGVRAYVGY